MMLFVPIRTVSATNMREHWTARHRRVELERAATWQHWHQQPNGLRCQVRKYGAWRVTLTRVSPGHRSLDSDNLTMALKAVRDEIARLLSVDDGDPRIEWVYKQVQGPWNVRIEIEEGTHGEPDRAADPPGAGPDQIPPRRAAPTG